MALEKKIIALLPMKAHSERVPGKNFRIFHGKPLYRWMLDTLLSIQEISSVIVNTDASDILSRDPIFEQKRIKLRVRAPHLCGDMVSMNKIIADDIQAVSAEFYLMSHVTNPLLCQATIKDVIQRFEEGTKDKKHDSLFTVNRYQSRFYFKDMRPVNHNPNQLIRTQDLESLYEENSSLYVFSAKSFSESGARIGLKPIMYETPRFESIDIDTEDDWIHAELIAKDLYKDF